MKAIDNIKKTQSRACSTIWDRVAITQEDITRFIQSYPYKMLWNWYEMDSDKHRKTRFREKQSIFLGKWIKSHVYKYKYHVSLQQLL